MFDKHDFEPKEEEVIKLAMEMLDREFREDQSAILSNEISRCMIQNNMTLENLDEACEIVREVFRKNATMKGWRKASPIIIPCGIHGNNDNIRQIFYRDKQSAQQL